MNSKVYKVTRDVTRDECFWLLKTVPSGTTVYEALKPTYGCCSPSGKPVSLNKDGDYPFFELPLDALELEGRQ